jgi:RHS repeat-associated protein
VDGLGRTVETITRHNEGQTPGVTERKILAEYGAIGGPVVITREEDGVKVSRRAVYDTLGQLRLNLGLDFGKWEYRYDKLGQLIETIGPTGNIGTYEYDAAGRQTRESYNGSVEAEYFYDQYPGDAVLGLADNFEWEGYPAYGVTIGRMVAVKDRTGVSLSAADFGSYSESWRVVNPDTRIYHFATKINGAGELIYAEDPDGAKSYADYYESGAIKGTSTEVWRNNVWERKQIVEDTKYNYAGQAELVTFGDGGNTKLWSGFNPVTHQSRATVVQQNRSGTKATLLAFGYQYDVQGKLEGIADWRGRTSGQGTTIPDLSIPHPSTLHGEVSGYQQFGFPSDFDADMRPPSELSAGGTPTGWPVGMTPSDAVFEYDTLNQLTGETRQYITGSGDDVVMNKEGQAGQRRTRSVTWDHDSQGSMKEWVEGGDNPAASVNLGRALGHITNGYQLNLTAGCDMNWYANNTTAPTNCYKPDALYFAENLDEVGAGRGTCVWLTYDNAGRMVKQIIRTGCSTCAFGGGTGDTGATCPGAPEVGTRGTAGYLPRVDAEIIRYEYGWNAQGQLSGAKKYVNNTEKVTMTYAYDASGGRVIREKFDDPTNIYQDLYISSGYERRQVQLQNVSHTPLSINNTDAGEKTFENIDGTRLVKYAAGARVQQKFLESQNKLEDAQIFLSFDNHLGSTSAVIDYDDGKLVEWNTNFAYGASESSWKNPDTKYDNAYEPYGFTGKEEDEAVGLHYFGARYYSSYIGRWLNPDPPVVHGGGYTNFYNYGGNSPYIYVDPDGNFIQAIIGAIVGFIVGVVTTVATGGNWKQALLNGLIGAVVGAATGGVGSAVSSAAVSAGASAFSAAVAGAVAASATAAAINFTISVASGANAGQAAINAGISFAVGVIGGVAGAGIGTTGIGQAGSYLANTAINAGLSATATVIKAAAYSGGDLSEADFDDTMRDWAIGTLIGTAASAVSAGVEGLGGNGEANNGSGESPSAAQSVDTRYEKWGKTKLGSNWRVSAANNSLNDGEVKLTDWNGNIHELGSKTQAMNWAYDQSLGGPQDNATYNGESVTLAGRREVQITFYQKRGSDQIYAVADVGEWNEGTMAAPNKYSLQKDSSISIIATAHTHPWSNTGDSPDYLVVENRVTNMPLSGMHPSALDYQSNMTLREQYPQQKPIGYVISNRNKFTAYRGYR